MMMIWLPFNCPKMSPMMCLLYAGSPPAVALSPMVIARTVYITTSGPIANLERALSFAP
jgi:hypothetical protein